MTLTEQSLVTIDDLSTGEIEAIFSLADEMSAAITPDHGKPRQVGELCRGKIMASLFFEPSTRTRLSFEAAMYRLGGSVITTIDTGATSLAKGESLADMARIIGSYADIIVIRHPWEGAAKVVADYSGVPVVNAGDGGHQHPTQTLLDLYTIRKERQTIKGLKIALWGDLKYGRTIHSLIFALAKFGANILFCPSPGLEVPEHIIQKLVTEYGGDVEKLVPPKQTNKERLFPLDAVYTTPTNPHQLAMIPDVSLAVELKTGVDALYVTRPQKERFTTAENDELEKNYLVVNKKLLEDKAFRKTLVMHPLPRIDELAYDLDTDPRSQYFKQAAHGVPVRMALLALLLGAENTAVPRNNSKQVGIDYPVCRQDLDLKCPNTRCVSTQKTETKYLKPEFKIVNRDPLTLRCTYCEHGFEPQYIASSNWHEGKLSDKKYHRADSHWARIIKDENLIVFASAAEAESKGFKPSLYTGGRH
ncbi:MAG: aspartate carbamoyltransferase [Dehalococcoidales bacterium]|jgi:aspartate carbamoyltransferase catalytic subunit|nr:aspartate carbamoyltransferase [Dehalococcoidales bacterium]MDP6738261.1 aspartate carbamoyltransferase [Dehalococcoidales bacterium]|tara:strand:+ start:5853 stop:7277 length:1425 start_codon:yes stop_codon:yes gene_type:complete